MIDAVGLPIQTSHYPLLCALDQYGPLSIGDLADSIGVAQPGVTKSVNRLVEDGLAETVPSETDQRRRMVQLSAAGKRLVDLSRARIWPHIQGGVADVCGGEAHFLLAILNAVEERMDDQALNRRIRRRLPEDLA